MIKVRFEALKNCPRTIPGNYIAIEYEHGNIDPLPPYFQPFENGVDTTRILDGFCKTDLCENLGFCSKSANGDKKVDYVPYKAQINYAGGVDAKKTGYREVDNLNELVVAITKYVEPYPKKVIPQTAPVKPR